MYESSSSISSDWFGGILLVAMIMAVVASCTPEEEVVEPEPQIVAEVEIGDKKVVTTDDGETYIVDAEETEQASEETDTPVETEETLVEDVVTEIEELVSETTLETVVEIEDITTKYTTLSPEDRLEEVKHQIELLKAEKHKLRIQFEIEEEQIEMRKQRSRAEHVLMLEKIEQATNVAIANQKLIAAEQGINYAENPMENVITTIKIAGNPACYDDLCKVSVERNGATVTEHVPAKFRPVVGDVFKEVCFISPTGEVKNCELYEQKQTVTYK